MPIRNLGSISRLHFCFVNLTPIRTTPHLPNIIIRRFNMSTHPDAYDAIIIGSGQAGTPLAAAFAKAGQKTVLIDRAHIGGCCVNEGCTPTKTLIASARAAYLTRRGQDYGIHTNSSAAKDGKNEVVVDMLRVRERKREIVESFRGGNEKRVADAGVTVMMGSAEFVDRKTVKVLLNGGGEKFVKGEKIFINVGERPAPPTLEGVESLDPRIVLDSTSIQELDVVPEHLVAIGGGYVGVEFAQYMSRLGARVSIVQRGRQLLPREDEEIAKVLLDILTEDGITTHLSSSAVSIAPSSSSPSSPGFTLKIKTSEGEQEISGSHILFASGRIPNTSTLNLQEAGITTNAKGYIPVNAYLETSASNIYALGDVKGPPAFTHISYDDFRIIRSNLLLSPSSPEKPKQLLTTTARQNRIPYVVYTDPQLAHIGLHESEARALFPEKEIKVARMPMSWVARALETDESRGIMKAVVDAESEQILGFTCLGMEGGEVMAVVQMAMLGGVGWRALEEAVWAHPSLAEGLNNLWGSLA